MDPYKSNEAKLQFNPKVSAKTSIVVKFVENRIIGIVLGFVVLTTVTMGLFAVWHYFKEDSLTPIERAKVILSDAPLIDGY